MATDDLILKAIAAAKNNDRESAKRLLSQAVIDNPKSVKAWYLLGQVVEHQDRAEYCFKKVLELEPGNQKAKKKLYELDLKDNVPAAMRPEPTTVVKPSITNRLNMEKSSNKLTSCRFYFNLWLFFVILIVLYNVGKLGFDWLVAVSPVLSSDERDYLTEVTPLIKAAQDKLSECDPVFPEGNLRPHISVLLQIQACLRNDLWYWKRAASVSASGIRARKINTLLTSIYNGLSDCVNDYDSAIDEIYMFDPDTPDYFALSDQHYYGVEEDLIMLQRYIK